MGLVASILEKGGCVQGRSDSGTRTYVVERGVLMRGVGVERGVETEEAGLVVEGGVGGEGEDVHDGVGAGFWERERAREGYAVLVEGVGCGADFCGWLGVGGGGWVGAAWDDEEWAWGGVSIDAGGRGGSWLTRLESGREMAYRRRFLAIGVPRACQTKRKI